MGITANCATVRLEGAVCIGVGSGVVYFLSAVLLERCSIDDVVQAVPVHYFTGVWGIIAAGFFTVPQLYKEAYGGEGDGGDDDEDDDLAQECCGVLYGCGGRQLAANFIFIPVHFVWIVFTAGLFLCVCHHKRILRVPVLTELVGLDEMFHSERDQGAVDRSMELTIGGIDAERLR